MQPCRSILDMEQYIGNSPLKYFGIATCYQLPGLGEEKIVGRVRMYMY